MRLELNEEIQNNIKEYAKHSGYHPDALIESIRSGFDTSENKAKWEGCTVGQTKEFLDNKCFENNIWYPNKTYYEEHLKPQELIDVVHNEKY